jgi:hypothetical protein
MATNVVFKNPSSTHTLRIRYLDKVPATKDPKTGGLSKPTWAPSNKVDGLIPPGQFLDVWLDGNRRITLEEIPS